MGKVEAIIVGGQAVEIYTAGQHTTGDVDLAVSDRSKAEKVLGGLGFNREGRIWIHPEWNIAIDLVASSLLKRRIEYVSSKPAHSPSIFTASKIL